MLVLINGLITGMIFGYIMKRSRICFTGLIRDIYLLGERYNALLFLMIIALQGVIYYVLGTAGSVRIPSYLPPFSLLSIALGSFLFGAGAVMAGGCLTATLVKCGDGRVEGWIYLAVFMLSAYLVAAGPLIGISKAMRSVMLVNDNLGVRTTQMPAVLFAAAAVILAVCMFRYRKRHQLRQQSAEKKTSLRSILFEKQWSRELGVILIGTFLGLVYLISAGIGRHFGMAITTPVMSWLYALLHPVETCGGCNPFDEKFGWGSMLAAGIILGSFVTSAAGRELHITHLHRRELLRGIAGAALMGVGAMWGLGCLLGNGLVGTAQLSVKSWYALVFLIAGIWTATRAFFIPMLRD